MTFKSFVKPLKIAWKIDSGFWTLLSIVLKSGLVAGPVKDPGSGFWPGQFFFFKSKQCRFSKKTKVNGFATGSCQLIPSVFFPFFSSTRPGSCPRSAGSLIDPSGRTEFQNYAWERGSKSKKVVCCVVGILKETSNLVIKIVRRSINI